MMVPGSVDASDPGSSSYPGGTTQSSRSWPVTAPDPQLDLASPLVTGPVGCMLTGSFILSWSCWMVVAVVDVDGGGSHYGEATLHGGVATTFSSCTVLS